MPACYHSGTPRRFGSSRAHRRGRPHLYDRTARNRFGRSFRHARRSGRRRRTRPRTRVPSQGMAERVDVPIVVTATKLDALVHDQIAAGARIVNVAAAKETAYVVEDLRRAYPNLPIMASGGSNDETILATIEAGANAISSTPPSLQELERRVVNRHRPEKRPHLFRRVAHCASSTSALEAARPTADCIEAVPTNRIISHIQPHKRIEAVSTTLTASIRMYMLPATQGGDGSVFGCTRIRRQKGHWGQIDRTSGEPHTRPTKVRRNVAPRILSRKRIRASLCELAFMRRRRVDNTAAIWFSHKPNRRAMGVAWMPASIGRDSTSFAPWPTSQNDYASTSLPLKRYKACIQAG